MEDDNVTPLAEHSERPADDAFDEAALEAKIQVGLDALNNGEVVLDAIAAMPTAPESESDDSSEAAIVDETGEAIGTSDDEAVVTEAAISDDEEVDDADISADDPSSSEVPILPDAYRRSMAAYGWTDETIDKNIELYGMDFIRTAATIHENRTSELQSWATIGREKRDSNAVTNPATASDLQQQASVPGMIAPIDVEQLKEKYGDDGLVDEIVGPLNAMALRMNAMIPILEAGQHTVEAAAAAQLEQVITNFFGGDSLKSYTELYGGALPMTAQHQQMRDEVLEMADALVVGARSQGRDMPVEDALTAAHDVVSAPYRATSERKKIQEAVEKRAKGASLRPSSRATAAVMDTDGPLTEQQIEDRVGDRMEAVFGLRPN